MASGEVTMGGGDWRRPSCECRCKKCSKELTGPCCMSLCSNLSSLESTNKAGVGGGSACGGDGDGSGCSGVGGGKGAGAGSGAGAPASAGAATGAATGAGPRGAKPDPTGAVAAKGRGAAG